MQLLTEAYLIVASNGSFGINTDIFETNLINQLIILGSVVFFGRDFLGESLSERQAEISSGVEDSEKRLNEATIRLDEAKKQLAQARVIIDQIKKETSVTKSTLLDADYNQAKVELSKRFNSAASILKFKERQILAEIKQYVSVLALELVVSQIEKKANLKSELSNYMQESINMVGAASSVPVVEIGEET
jgi:F-type H+-transporting ATPase subunit b|tara:strand:- start:1738 stop:2307 length:570 start_codon:yes stop_codon:yes gene_type:complete